MADDEGPQRSGPPTRLHQADARSQGAAHDALRRVLVVGATGMLGRPVVRALAEDPDTQVTAFVRDAERARRRLPKTVGLRIGDLRDLHSVSEALRDQDAVYLNLNTPFDERAEFDPDRDGTAIVAKLAREAGLERILRLSALGAAPDDPWWVARRKYEADELVRGSGVPFTIFHPTWFMESLALSTRGPLTICVSGPMPPLRWIAGADHGRQVVRAVQRSDAANRNFVVQGCDEATIIDATRRFARALPGRHVMLSMPLAPLRGAGRLVPMARYMVDLLDLTRRIDQTDQARETWTMLGRPQMSIEDYAASISVTGDMPRK